MRLRHRVRTAATPAQVWAVLGNPSRWPEYDVFLSKVRGAPGRAVPGDHLLGIARGLGVRVPVDVLEAVPERRLALRVHTAPGVTEELTYDVVPLVRGGCDITVSVVVEGLFARGAVLPLWLANGLTARVLVRRVDQLSRAARRAA